jgi:hypothetical protein
MLPENIQSFTRAVPFQPIRVTLTNGEEFDLQHPDMIVAAYNMATILRPGGAGERSSVVHVSMDHILKVELLTPNAAPPRNRSTA